MVGLSICVCVHLCVRTVRNGWVHFTVPRCDTFTKLTPTVHFDIIYWCHMMVCVLDLYLCFSDQGEGEVVESILQYLWVLHSPTYTSCSSWHDLLMSYDGLCPWPIFHASLTMVRKKWLSLYTVPMGATFTKLTPAVHLDVSLTYISPFINHG